MVIMMNFSYNIILGRSLIRKINIVVNNRYVTIKFPTNKGMAIMRGSHLISRICTLTCIKRKNTLCVDHIVPMKEKLEIKIKNIEELKKVSLHQEENAFFKTRSTLDIEQDKTLVKLLNIQKPNFVFKPSNMSND